MKKGEIWDAFFDPTLGSEQAGRRPAVIISGNLVNDNVRTVIVCPLTSKLKEYKGNLVLDPNDRNGLDKRSEVMTIHIRSLSKERLKRKVGEINDSEMAVIIDSLDKIIRY
jgi:mRNA interferase MazF